MNPDWLAEGLCPTHGTPLDRMPEYGRCDECGLGFSLTPDAISVHLLRRTPEDRNTRSNGTSRPNRGPSSTTTLDEPHGRNYSHVVNGGT